jgi:hypothetical protein
MNSAVIVLRRTLGSYWDRVHQKTHFGAGGAEIF